MGSIPYVAILCLAFCLYAIEAKKAICVMDETNGRGKVKGAIMLLEKYYQDHEKKVIIVYQLEGITPENTLHGFHIHERGHLGNACMNAGGHFNPENKVHGDIKDEERHLGDLGNIHVHSGIAKGVIVDYKISLFGENTVIGKAFVLHEGVDDLGRGGHPSSNTTGNAGSRLQCCVIKQIN